MTGRPSSLELKTTPSLCVQPVHSLNLYDNCSSPASMQFYCSKVGVTWPVELVPFSALKPVI